MVYSRLRDTGRLIVLPFSSQKSLNKYLVEQMHKEKLGPEEWE